jgi:hypothetical protein
MPPPAVGAVVEGVSASSDVLKAATEDLLRIFQLKVTL